MLWEAVEGETLLWRLYMLLWDDVVKRFENLVKYASKNEFLQNKKDSAVSPEDLYQIGMLKLYECFERYKTLSLDEFKYVFSTSLFRAIRKGLKQNRLDVDLILDDSEVNFELEDLTVQDSFQDCEFKEGLEQLRMLLSNSPIALAILSEMVEPSPRTIWEVWADKARKEKIKSQGQKINLPKTTEVRMKHIKSALKLTQKQFDLGILEIRSKSKMAFVGGTLYDN